MKTLKQFNSTIILNRSIAPNLMHLAFEWPEDLQPPLPGQFFTFLPSMVESSAGIILRRPLAFAGFEPKKNTADSSASLSAIAHSIYQIRGPCTKALALQQAGSYIDIIASLGNSFPYPDREEEVIIAGGGIGIGPMLFLAASLAENIAIPEDHIENILKPLESSRSSKEMKLIFGFRSMPLVPSFKEATGNNSIAKTWERLLSGAFIATDDGSKGFHGTVLDALEFLKKTDKLARFWHVYGCGPEAMIAKLAAFAKRNNFPAHLSAEQWMACGIGACQGCVLPARTGGYLRVCSDGPVFEANAIDWEACL
ncbi:MAG TPA: hypothetical protein PLH76_02695 [Rectinema sp.]|nr:hypothetical protein [Rectinema sp.]